MLLDLIFCISLVRKMLFLSGKSQGILTFCKRYRTISLASKELLRQQKNKNLVVLSQIPKMPNHLCKRKMIITWFIFTRHCYKLFSVKLERFEIPQRLTLVTEQWTPETELVTASLKLKRTNISTQYRQELDAMYNK